MPLSSQLVTPSSSAAADSNWFDVGIIKGTSCTVSSYYLPSGELEKSEIDVEGDENLLRKVCKKLLYYSPLLFLAIQIQTSVYRWTCNPAPPTSSAWRASMPAAGVPGLRSPPSRRVCPASPGRPPPSRSQSPRTGPTSAGSPPAPAPGTLWSTGGSSLILKMSFNVNTCHVSVSTWLSSPPPPRPRVTPRRFPRRPPSSPSSACSAAPAPSAWSPTPAWPPPTSTPPPSPPSSSGSPPGTTRATGPPPKSGGCRVSGDCIRNWTRLLTIC